MVNFMAAMWFRIGLIAAAFSLSTLPAQACSCAGGNPGSCEVPVGDIIVRATVVSKEINQTQPPFARPPSSGVPPSADRRAGPILQPEPWGRVKVTLSVSERFRGAAGDSLVVNTELGTEACGYPFEVGHEYLVFAYENLGKVTVTTCSGTQPSKMAVARIEQLRALRDGSTLPDLYGFVGTHPLRSGEAGWEQVQPMAGLTVTARSDSAEYRTQTADNGLYGFHGLPAGRYRLSVGAPPGRRALWGGGAEHPGTGPGSPCAMNFEVFWDGLISGTIVGRDGQPASGMITAQYAGPEPADFFIAAVKESAGSGPAYWAVIIPDAGCPSRRTIVPLMSPSQKTSKFIAQVLPGPVPGCSAPPPHSARRPGGAPTLSRYRPAGRPWNPYKPLSAVWVRYSALSDRAVTVRPAMGCTCSHPASSDRRGCVPTNPYRSGRVLPSRRARNCSIRATAIFEGWVAEHVVTVRFSWFQFAKTRYS